MSELMSCRPERTVRSPGQPRGEHVVDSHPGRRWSDPLEGVVVERAFQYARGSRGESFLWLGRDKRVGTGEGSSLLRHDRADRIDVV